MGTILQQMQTCALTAQEIGHKYVEMRYLCPAFTCPLAPYMPHRFSLLEIMPLPPVSRNGDFEVASR